MNFGSDDSNQSERPERQTGSAEPKYAVDEGDNAFIKLLILATERCLAYADIVKEEDGQRKYVRKAQAHIDFLNNKFERYTDCDLTIIDDYVDEAAKELEEDLERHEAQKEKLADCTERRRRCFKERERELKRLYAVSQKFIDSVGSAGGMQLGPGVRLDFEFCKALTNFAAQAGIVADGGKELVRLRRRAVAIQTASHGGSHADAKEKRKEALARFSEQEVKLEMQRQNMLESEQRFYSEQVHPLLCEAKILPDRRESVSSSSSGDLSRVEERPEDSAEADSIAPSPPSHLPQRRQAQKVLDAKAALAKAIATLDSLKEEYVTSLAETLITFTGLKQDDFDAAWERDHGEQSYYEQQVERTETMTAAEATYQQALQEAEEAGITPLPPSPRDTGNRSRDGETDSEREESETNKSRARSNRKPATRTWIKRVAKSGSPLSPSTAPTRPSAGVSKRPRGNVRPNWGFMVEQVPRHTSIQRHGRHQDAMRRRAEAQIEELPNVNSAVAPPAPLLPPTPPPAAPAPLYTRWCNVQ